MGKISDITSKMPIVYSSSKMYEKYKKSGASGEDAKLKKVDIYTKEQKKLHKKVVKSIDTKAFNLKKDPLFKAGQKFVQDMLNPSSEAFKKFEAPYLRDFRETVIPELAERFSGYGAQDSSGFTRALSHRSSALKENLAALKTQGMMDASSMALNYAQAPAQMQQSLISSALGSQPFGYQVMPGKQSTKSAITSGLVRGGATMGAYALGNYLAPGVGGPIASTAVNAAWQ